MTEAYREALIGSINTLIQARHKFFGEALNLAMSGDMGEINDAFEVGDTFTFELSHLKDSADPNVNKLVKRIEEIQTTIDNLIEENEIEDDEIQWEENLPEDTGSGEETGEDNGQPTPKVKISYEMDPEEDQNDSAYIFNWVITYGDGTQELFRGFADEAFEYALNKSRKFSVEKAEEQDEPGKMKSDLSAKESLESIVNHFFDDSSKNPGQRPKFTILMGDVGSGKTTLRKEEYSKRYVLLDAAEIFSTLCNGKDLDFPSTLEKPMSKIGVSVALRAINEKRNIVTEVIGKKADKMGLLTEAMESMGYKIILVLIPNGASKTGRKKTKKLANISALECEPFHIKWIHSALKKIKA